MEGHIELCAAEPGMHEYDSQAIVEYAFRRGGAERLAYGSIVGSGPKASELHLYMKDRGPLIRGTWWSSTRRSVRGYATDITRTFR